MATLFANSGDPDQMPHSVASDLGLHCLPITLLRVSRIQLVIILFLSHSVLVKKFSRKHFKYLFLFLPGKRA